MRRHRPLSGFASMYPVWPSFSLPISESLSLLEVGHFPSHYSLGVSFSLDDSWESSFSDLGSHALVVILACGLLGRL